MYDVKLMMSGVDGLHGGLQKVAEDLKVERIGPMHQAGSDSLLTASTFFALREVAIGREGRRGQVPRRALRLRPALVPAAAARLVGRAVERASAAATPSSRTRA